MRPAPLATWLALASATAVAACSGDALRLLGSPDAGVSGLGRVRVELTLPRDADPVLYTEARFVRFAELDGESAQLLAGASLPSVDVIPVGRCVRYSSEAWLGDVLGSAPAEASVAMLDAGDVLVRAAGMTDRLVPRYVPEILPFVSGVAYEREDRGAAAGAPAWQAGDEIAVSAFGGPEVGHFDAVTTAPALPRVTSLAGVDPARSFPAVAVDQDLEVLWSESPRGDDVILVTLRGTGDDAVICRPAQPGRQLVPRALVAGIADGAEQLSVSVERVRRVPLGVPGLDGAELIVSVRDLVLAQVQ